MKAIAYNVVSQNMIHTQVATKREAREVIAEFKRLAKIEGVKADVFTIEAVR